MSALGISLALFFLDSAVLLDLLLFSAVSLVSKLVDFAFEEEAGGPRTKDVTSGINYLRLLLDRFSLALYLFLSLPCLLSFLSTPVDPDLLVDPFYGW